MIENKTQQNAMKIHFYFTPGIRCLISFICLIQKLIFNIFDDDDFPKMCSK